ncbi:hypothetical protein JHK82_028038 [Glycine max]|nr:hypothetical protein JHK82_028038 [Glycine max]KAG5151816.1 hypothetical protein JHK84_028288 [Glycine max]
MIKKMKLGISEEREKQKRIGRRKTYWRSLDMYYCKGLEGETYWYSIARGDIFGREIGLTTARHNSCVSRSLGERKRKTNNMCGSRLAYATKCKRRWCKNGRWMGEIRPHNDESLVQFQGLECGGKGLQYRKKKFQVRRKWSAHSCLSPISNAHSCLSPLSIRALTGSKLMSLDARCEYLVELDLLNATELRDASVAAVARAWNLWRLWLARCKKLRVIC